MKRIEYKRNIKIPAVFTKHRAVILTAVCAAAAFTALSIWFDFARRSKEAAQPVDASSSVSSGEPEPAVSKNASFEEQMDALREIAQAGGGITIPVYKTAGNIYESKGISANPPTLKDFLDIFGSLPLEPCGETGFPSADSLIIDASNNSGQSFSLSFCRETPSSSTYVRIVLGSQTAFFYKSSSSAYDTVMENVSDKTIHYTKVIADRFLNAFKDKNASALKSLVPDGSAADIDQWEALGSGTDIRNLQAVPVTVDDTQAVYKVSFDIPQGGSLPFSEGHNERILEIGYPDGSDTPCALLFVEAGKYTEPDTAEKQMCCNFIRYGTAEPFASPSDLSADSILQYILNLKTGSVKRDMYHYVLSQQDVDAYAKSCFGIDHVEGGKMKPYSNGNYYTWPKYFSQPNCRVLNETEGDDGSRFVTVEFFKDALQTIHDRYTVYTLVPNSNGTDRFASAANEDSVDVSEG